MKKFPYLKLGPFGNPNDWMISSLSDQSVQPLPRDNHILNFLDAEANINDSELYEPKDEYINQELAAANQGMR